MPTNTSNDSFALLAQVASFAQDPSFCGQLRELVTKHEAKLRVQAQRAVYAQQMREAAAGDARVDGLLALYSRGELNYSETQWVPDIYQALENNGLVFCQHGPRNDAGLTSRHLTLSTAGRALAEELKALTPVAA